MNEKRTIEAVLALGAKQPLSVEKLELSKPQGKEVLVKVVAVGVCHTDIMTKYEGLCQFPMVLGHEGVGIVESVGEEVAGLTPGQRILMSYDSCGHCPQCDDKLPSYCNDHGSLNFSGTRPDGRLTHSFSDSGEAIYGSFFQQSSFANYALCHESNATVLDDDLPLPLMAPLACGVQTGAGTVMNTLSVKPNTTIAIFGCGCVGLSAVMAAKAVGAKHIIAVDLNQDRLDTALEIGATATVNPSELHGEKSVIEAVQSLSDGSCHYAIDTTGVPAVLRQAFDCCGPLGVTAMIAPGVPGTEVSIEMMGLLPGKSLRGVVQGDSLTAEFVPKLIALWREGKLPLERFVSYYRSIDQLPTAFEDMKAGRVIKPVVIIDESYLDESEDTAVSSD